MWKRLQQERIFEKKIRPTPDRFNKNYLNLMKIELAKNF